MRARISFDYSPAPDQPRRAIGSCSPREAAELDMAALAVLTKRLGLQGTWSLQDLDGELGQATAELTGPANADTGAYRMVRPGESGR